MVSETNFSKFIEHSRESPQKENLVAGLNYSQIKNRKTYFFSSWLQIF